MLDVWNDEIFNLQNRFKRGTFFHETTLFLWDLIDGTLNRCHMTFLANCNLIKPNEEDVQCRQCKKVLYDLGITKMTTPGRNTVSAYSVECTLCGILKHHSRVDIQIVTEAFRRFKTRTDKNILILSEYAKILKDETKLKSYLEVLL